MPEALENKSAGCAPYFDRCFAGIELAVETGLKDVDPEKLKNEIKRWAKAVVAYTRQLSFHQGTIKRTEN